MVARVLVGFISGGKNTYSTKTGLSETKWSLVFKHHFSTFSKSPIILHTGYVPQNIARFLKFYTFLKKSIYSSL